LIKINRSPALRNHIGLWQQKSTPELFFLKGNHRADFEGTIEKRGWNFLGIRNFGTELGLLYGQFMY